MNKEEKKAIEYLKRHILPYYGNKGRIEFMLNDTILNLIKKQQKELEPIKKLNIPVETLVSEFNRLEDLEDNTEMLKSELEKKDKIIDKLLMEITAVNSGRYEYMENDRVLEIFTNLVEKEDK